MTNDPLRAPVDNFVGTLNEIVAGALEALGYSVTAPSGNASG